MKEIESFLDNYKSPIKIIEDQINSNFENGILKAVHSFGIDVDVEELKKALKYDRNQYMQGYEFGRKKAVKEFAEQVKMAFYVEFDELIPSIMADRIDELVKEYENDKSRKAKEP